MKMQIINKYEYKIETFRGFTTKKKVEEMNNLGADGWSLVSVVDTPAAKEYIFKREIICEN